MDYMLEIFGGSLCYCFLVCLLLALQLVLAVTPNRVGVRVRMALWVAPQLLVIAAWVVWTHTVAVNFFDDSMLCGVPLVMAIVTVVGCAMIMVLSRVKGSQAP
jgi:hypothetical protein